MFTMGWWVGEYGGIWGGGEEGIYRWVTGPGEVCVGGRGHGFGSLGRAVEGHPLTWGDGRFVTRWVMQVRSVLDLRL